MPVRRYWAPKDTPETVIDVLADAIEAALKSDEAQAHISASGEELAILRGEELRDAVTEEYQSFLDIADVVRETSGG